MIKTADTKTDPIMKPLRKEESDSSWSSRSHLNAKSVMRDSRKKNTYESIRHKFILINYNYTRSILAVCVKQTLTIKIYDDGSF